MSASTHHYELVVPELIQQCSGIRLGDKLVKSLVFSTDVAVIRNCDADAVLCVYPFACDEHINRSVIKGAGKPVINGVAGAITAGDRCINLALAAQADGSAAVVANMMTDPADIQALAQAVEIPVVLTVATLDDATRLRISAGASIVNVAAGHKTPRVVEALRGEYPNLPIKATGGKAYESLRRTIDAGASAITWTPPSIQEIERQVMLGHRIRANA